MLSSIERLLQRGGRINFTLLSFPSGRHDRIIWAGSVPLAINLDITAEGASQDGRPPVLRTERGFPPNPHAETLTPNVTMSAGRASGRW